MDIVKNCMDSCGYTPQSIDNFLYTMNKSKYIQKIKGSTYKAEYMPADQFIKYPSADVDNDHPPKASSKKSTVIDKSDPAIKIDVIKSTGRVRLTVKGLVIEIGVVD